MDAETLDIDFNTRLKREKEKYERAYQAGGYKMGRARMHHATSILKTWPPGSYLDVGCGRGEMLDCAKTLAFDPIQGTELVYYLVENRGDVVFADGAHLPFSDSQFDYVSMLDVVEHIPEEDIYDVFNELARVAKSKILLCIANFPHKHMGDELHITLKPYKEWDRILKEHYPDWEVTWLPKDKNISETWELTRGTE